MTMGRIIGKSLGLLPIYFLCITLFYSVIAQELAINDLVVPKSELGLNATLTCSVFPATADITWYFDGQPLNNTEQIKINKKISNIRVETQLKESTLYFAKTTRKNAGNYTCVATLNEQNATKTELLDLSFPARFVSNKTRYEANYTKNDHGHNVTLECIFDMYYKPDTIMWWTKGNAEPQIRNVTQINDRLVNGSLELEKVTYDSNGEYNCSVWDRVTSTNVTGKIDLVVYGDPKVELITVMGISRSQIFVNWTINPANSKILGIVIRYCVNCSTWRFANSKIEPNMTSYVIEGLKNSTNYSVRLDVYTEHGYTNNSKPKSCMTLEEDPVFVPNISINGFSATSVTIGWLPPPKEIEPYIHYYLLEARKKDGGTPRKAYHSRDSRNLPYMFDNLDPHSTYIFKVRACQDFTKQCGNWSMETEAATLDGIPGRASNVSVNCSSSHMTLWWGPPIKPNAEIKGYTIELTGYAEYRDRNGAIKKETWGPLSRFKSNESTNARFDDLQPNTNYTVRLSAMTRTRRRGEEEVVHCKTLPAPPDTLPRPRWRKILDKDRYLFKMYLPKVSERNGPICCYRVYMVRLLPNMDLRTIKSQASLEVITYHEAHAVQPVLGGYITDIFTNDNFPKDGELLLGNDHVQFNRSEPVFNTSQCRRCVQLPQRAPPPAPAAPVPPAAPARLATAPPPAATDEPARERRAVGDSEGEDIVELKDGPLDSNANYSAFIELIPYPVEEQPQEVMYSEYLNQLMPAPSPVAPTPATTLEIALQVTCAVAALVLLIMVIFCVMQTRRSRKLPPHANMEMNRFPKIIRYMWAGTRPPGGAAPAMPPLARAELAAAYCERHADCDYGFQKEFELLQMLSECFPDRTTHASEARENQPKNRYPDIKAYDQTRVKLAQIDGITGSDYINANYVMGYKERKKFICAQGPTDTTVNDFWRMIWEHGLELIVMLTNLEEYSKVKCSKYWPDEIRGTKAFGAITVQHVSEKRYSDYVVRELKITKQPTTSEGQPIVENNGIAKRNGDIKEPSESAPTSPREIKETTEYRIVRQYHFLMWKDFAAPEHPHSILKFIKRVNEAWSNMVGRPVVVHCSAGVGRTGTLVALDCLLEQLNSTGQVSVFNTIAELRRQRNFLVQSQKQYVFVYRALVEYAHYGDTEIPASRLKASIDRLRNTPEGADKCLMEHDFEKMMDSPVAEAVKSCAAGQAEELRPKNRSADCLPYDRNRVMLTPIPGRDYSTYINASFVEAYDNTEGFIITQDPLPNTIFDFWRMVSEQTVSTIVMLSELGEGKCPRYWDDSTAQYEHISVTYDESESCPYYTRRQFRVTNNKTGHSSPVHQLQYQGWPTAPGHVPEVTRGLAELADAVAGAGGAAAGGAGGATLGPMVVHCNLGTERSALFVALCILICQLRTERRVDVSAVARKVRSQRANTIDTFLQYEFLHRAILNYAELHNLLEDS